MLSSPDGPAFPRIELITLGRARCQSTAPNRATRTLLHGGKGLALLIYAASLPNRSVTRAQLVDLLWSNVDRDVARADLRQALWYLRHVTHGAVVTSADDVLVLDRGVQSDHQLFVDAVHRHDHELALATYAGDFLPIFARAGGAAFEHWADVERLRLQTLYCGIVEEAVLQALGRDNVNEAIRIAQLAASVTRAHRLQRLLVMTLESTRERDDCGHAQRADVLPEMRREQAAGSLRRQSRRVGHTGLPSHYPTRAVPGRTANSRSAEMGDLRAAWAKARQHQYVYRHITGAPGTGKSSLLAEFLADIHAATAGVAAVAARSVERSIPFSLLSKVAAALGQLRGACGISPTTARTLVGLNPTLSSVFCADPVVDNLDDVLRNRTTAVRELIAVVADEAPLCLVIDDVHHSDDASRRSLEAITANLSREPVMFLTSSCASDARLG